MNKNVKIENLANDLDIDIDRAKSVQVVITLSKLDKTNKTADQLCQLACDSLGLAWVDRDYLFYDYDNYIAFQQGCDDELAGIEDIDKD